MRRPWVTKYRGDIHLKLPKRRHRTFSGQPAEARTASAGPVSETSLSDIPADAESPLLAQHASEPEQVAVELSPEEPADTGTVSEYHSAAPFNPVPQPDFEYQAPPNSIFEEEPAAAGGQEEDLALERSFRPVLEEPAEIVADLPEQPVLGEPSYVALEWRRPSILFLALGWLLSAYAGPVVLTLLQGGMPALMTATGWMGIGVMGLPFLLFMGVTILLINSRTVTMPIIFGTTYAVTHALTLIGVAVLSPVVFSGSAALASQIAGEAPQLAGIFNGGPRVILMALYSAAFLAFSIYAFFAALLLRYVGMQLVR